MKRLLLIVLPISLFVFSCEEEQDTTPPTVTITFPQTNSTVSEMVTINCISSDNEGVEKVELWVNGVTTELTDDTEPYSFDWNTTLVDNGNYTITVRSYDLSDNVTDSEPIILIVDNTQSNPTPVVLYPITYSDGFQISWTQNNDDDFKSYKLYESLSEDMSNQTFVYETTEREDTNYVVTGINEVRYYQITTEDIWGLQSISDIEVLLIQVELWGEYYLIEYTTEINLSFNQLTGSIPPEIGNLTNLTFLTLGGNQLSGSIPPEIGNLTNLTTLILNNNQLTGSIPPEIGNLTNLTYLNLFFNRLTGSIPSEIGTLTNLTGLDLSYNELTGIIPDEICNQGDSSPNLSNNQLCPTYPYCIEDYVGEQDTSNCD